MRLIDIVTGAGGRAEAEFAEKGKPKGESDVDRQQRRRLQARVVEQHAKARDVVLVELVHVLTARVDRSGSAALHEWHARRQGEQARPAVRDGVEGGGAEHEREEEEEREVVVRKHCVLYDFWS